MTPQLTDNICYYSATTLESKKNTAVYSDRELLLGMLKKMQTGINMGILYAKQKSTRQTASRSKNIHA